MTQAKQSAPVGTWLFLFSAFFAAGLMVLLARPVIDRMFHKVSEADCGGRAIPRRPAPAATDQPDEIEA